MYILMQIILIGSNLAFQVLSSGSISRCKSVSYPDEINLHIMIKSVPNLIKIVQDPDAIFDTEKKKPGLNLAPVTGPDRHQS